MKNSKLFAVSLVLVLVLGLSMLSTSCSKKEEGQDLPEPSDETTLMTLDLNSDSENGVEWKFEQDNKIFTCEDVFLQDEGSETGSGELQSFELRPVKGGSATLTFSNESYKTTYTYEVEVSDDKSEITVKSSKGDSDGTEVDAPQMTIEKN